MVQRESNFLTHPDSSGCGRYTYKSEVSAPLAPTWGAVKKFGWAYKSDPVRTRCSASVLGYRRGRAAARPYVRLKACLIGEVRVLFRYTLSGL